MGSKQQTAGLHCMTAQVLQQQQLPLCLDGLVPAIAVAVCNMLDTVQAQGPCGERLLCDSPPLLGTFNVR